MAPQDTYCGLCGGTATMTCFGCRSISYCTVECLEADERAHRHLCGQVAAFEQRPSSGMRRGILLPESEKEPCFVWYPLTIFKAGKGEESIYYENEVDDTYGIPEFDPVPGMKLGEFNELLNKGNKSWSTIRASDVVTGSFGGGLHLDHTIYAAYRNCFLGDGSKTNQCLEYLTRGRSESRWRGPILLHGMTKFVQSAHCVDLGASDLTIGVEGTVKHMALQGGPSMVRGVKVNLSPPYFEQVKVPIQHPIFSVGAHPSVSVQTRLLLRTHLYTNNGSTNTTAAICPAAYLHVIIGPRDIHYTIPSDIGQVPKGWIDNARSVLLVKTNPNDPNLSTKSAKAICMFARQQTKAISAANTSLQAAARYIESNLTKEKAMQTIKKIEKELDGMEEADFISEFEKLGMDKA